MTKEKRLAELYKEYKEEFKVEEFVPGDGNVHSDVVLVGEAPGKDEVRQAKPFVGMAGKNLNEFFEAVGMNREDIYITNIIKYRLSRKNPKTGKTVNRPATKKEIDESRRYLQRELLVLEPRYIVTLGNSPLKAVDQQSNDNIGKVHGKLKTVNILGKEFQLFPLYHPASVIYNRSLRDVYISDLNELKRLIYNYGV